MARRYSSGRRVNGQLNCINIPEGGVHHTKYVVTSWWGRWCLKSPASRLFTQPFVQAQIKEYIKAPHHWTLWGEFTGQFRCGLLSAILTHINWDHFRVPANFRFVVWTMVRTIKLAGKRLAWIGHYFPNVWQIALTKRNFALISMIINKNSANYQSQYFVCDIFCILQVQL